MPIEGAIHLHVRSHNIPLTLLCILYQCRLHILHNFLTKAWHLRVLLRVWDCLDTLYIKMSSLHLLFCRPTVIYPSFFSVRGCNFVILLRVSIQFICNNNLNRLKKKRKKVYWEVYVWVCTPALHANHLMRLTLRKAIFDIAIFGCYNMVQHNVWISYSPNVSR